MKLIKRWSDWAARICLKVRKTAYNTAVNSKDMDTVKLAVDGLKANLKELMVLNLNFTKAKHDQVKNKVIVSWAEVTEAMSDPRYAKDYGIPRMS